MRPFFGVALELVALAIVAYLASALVNWYPLSVLVLFIAQILTTVLIHCPAHYLVGRLLGIEFSGIRLGRSSAVRLLPTSLERIGGLLVVFTLKVDPRSKMSAPPKRLRVMFLAGVVASLGSAITFAIIVSLTGNHVIGLITWLFAIAYAASDILFSPKAGDLMKARAYATKR